MGVCCSATSCIPTKIDLLPPLKALAPASFVERYNGKHEIKPLEQEELNFFDRVVIPGVFAELIACMAVLNTLANLILTGALYLSYYVHCLIETESACAAISEKAQECLMQTLSNAVLSTGIFYALVCPNEILEAVFIESPQLGSEETPNRPLEDSNKSDSPLSPQETLFIPVVPVSPLSDALPVEVTSFQLTEIQQISSPSPMLDELLQSPPAQAVSPMQAEESPPAEVTMTFEFTVKEPPSAQTMDEMRPPSPLTPPLSPSDIAITVAPFAAPLQPLSQPTPSTPKPLPFAPPIAC